MSDPVSIVIPTFNRADLLPMAIDSALAQTLPCEVVVVDHGSSDATPDVVAAYGDKVLYVRKDRDFGPIYAWLDGVMHSSGELVHLQYDDDWIAPEFAEVLQGLMRDPEVGFAFSASEVVRGEDMTRLMTQFDDWLPATGTYPVPTLEDRVVSTILSPGCALFRRDVLIDSLYQGRLPLQTQEYHGAGPDTYASLLSMLRYPKIGYAKEILASFRAHDGSITIDAFADQQKSQKLNATYNEVRRFYLELKAMNAIRKSA